ncbi:hypothetical protein [Hymenobacter sublimis]|uniref:STAS/SEC14 domain-containing protein n=2 Tax=Hymenobacter TaxID=89966 RepID=A0ABY4JDJ3_9BACT|nr:hypothetical protein [Hymenobacter sublimis]UPL50863.1 hypothetical protein MWH26_08145 [Hymenobacter sublimis]
MPALSAGGLRRLAVVESEDLLNRVLIEDAYTTPVHILNIEFKRFADLPAARAWACS